MMIDKVALSNLVEPFFKESLKSKNYQVQIIKANKLLIHSRLDIAFKLLYLEMKNKEVSFAKSIYKEHIRAFSLGKFIEHGNNNKNNIDKFMEEFDEIFSSIKKNGFDGNKTLIPLSKNGTILNGAHRLASSIYLDKEVKCVKIEAKDCVYDYKYFYNRNVPSSILDIAVLKFIEYANNTFIAFIWPVAQGHDQDIEKIIPNIAYRRNIKLNANGAHNLLSQVYYGEQWLGNVRNNFKGLQANLIKYFKTFDPIRVIVFQAHNLNEALEIKDKIRNIFNIGKPSVHITDSKEEAIRVARVIFNDNSIHFLNNAAPNKYLSAHKKITTYKKYIKDNDLNSDDMVLDGGVVLSAYGLRKSSDVDYLMEDNKKNKRIQDGIEMDSHDRELKYHDETKLELIYNPKFYFYFNELKFIAFNQLYRMKKNRAEKKDMNDLQIMDAVTEYNGFKKNILGIKQNILYFRVRHRKKIRFCYNSFFVFIFIYFILSLAL